MLGLEIATKSFGGNTLGNRDKHLLTQLDTIAKGLSETLFPFAKLLSMT